MTGTIKNNPNPPIRSCPTAITASEFGSKDDGPTNNMEKLPHKAPIIINPRLA
jgi:hypothetical protein